LAWIKDIVHEDISGKLLTHSTTFALPLKDGIRREIYIHIVFFASQVSLFKRRFYLVKTLSNVSDKLVTAEVRVCRPN
jgi:hypothetical protein